MVNEHRVFIVFVVTLDTGVRPFFCVGAGLRSRLNISCASRKLMLIGLNYPGVAEAYQKQRDNERRALIIHMISHCYKVCG